MTLGEKIKELRIAHNESLQQLADEIGISKAHLWELERNNSQNPSLDTLKNIAQHFKVSIDSLVDIYQDISSLVNGRKKTSVVSAKTTFLSNIVSIKAIPVIT